MSSRKRVLRIQSRICVGGPALHTIFLSQYLEDHYETLLIGGCLEPSEKSMTPFALSRGVPVRIVEEMGRTVSAFDDFRALLRLMRIIRLFKPDVVHTHTAKAGALGRVAAFLCRVPVRVHTFHGHVFKGYFSPLKTRLTIWVERMLALLSTKIIAISPAQKEDLVRLYRVVPERKCEVIRLGFELTHFEEGTPGRFRQRLQVPQQAVVLGIVARLVDIKNHQLLLHALADLFKTRPHLDPGKLRLWIVGDGELRPDLEALSRRLGIDAFCQFLGWQHELADLYADMDLNVLVSKNEGTPVTLIEGLVCGVPVLATDVGGIRDFTDDDCATIVDAQVTSSDFAAALARILGDPITRPARISPAKRLAIKSTFGVTRLADDVDRLYRRCL